MRKYEDFLATGLAECKHHGRHPQWTYYPSKTDKNGRPYPGIACRICEREHTKRWNAEHPTYQDEFRYSRNGVVVRCLAQARRRANERGVAFDLDRAWFEERLTAQGGRCEYSGVEFEWGEPVNAIVRWRLPSIDRRAAGGPYSKDNSALVCSGVNMMKSLVPFEEFVFFCKAIAAHRS